MVAALSTELFSSPVDTAARGAIASVPSAFAALRKNLEADEAQVLATGWPELDAVLPDHGFAHGIVELAAPHALGGATTVAMALVRAAHAKHEEALAAWIDPDGSLYAPSLAQAQVDLDRLLVVRPPSGDLRRVAVNVAASGAFDVVVVDMKGSGKGMRDDVFVRKLSLSKCRVLLLTDSYASKSVPWPTSLRLELSRQADSGITLRIAKDRSGRIGTVKTLRNVPWLAA